MAWATIDQENITGMNGFIKYFANTWAGAIPLTLFVLFLIVTLGTYLKRSSKSDYGVNFWEHFVVGAIFIDVVAFIMGLMDGVINMYTILLCIVLTAIGLLFLNLTGNRD